MKTTNMGRILILILGLIFILAGCSSLDKARSLHQKGQNDEALEMAQDLLDDGEDEKTRLGAISLIGQIGGDKAGQILMPVMDDPALPVKNAAIRTIGKMAYAPASKKLLSIAMTSKGDTFEAAAAAIRDMGPPAIDLLVKKYTQASSGAEKESFKTLMLAVGPRVASGIAKNLAGKSYFENRTNFDLLIAFKSPEVADWLIKEIGNREIAENIVEGLVKLGRQAVSPVMMALEDLPANKENVSSRIRLITVLGHLKARQATDLIEKLTRDDSNQVRKAADQALKRIRGF